MIKQPVHDPHKTIWTSSAPLLFLHETSTPYLSAMEEGPLRLLNLPREVRFNIYAQILCCFPDAPSIRKAQAQNTRIPAALFALHEHGGVETAILRPNRQDYSEASFVFLQNRSIRVVVHNVSFHPADVTKVLPLVPMSKHALDTFRLSRFRHDPFH